MEKEDHMEMEDRSTQREQRNLVKEEGDARLAHIRHLSELQARILIAFNTASMYQAFGAANRILDEGLTAINYGLSFGRALRTSEMILFDTLRSRAELVLRLFLEDNVGKLATAIAAGNINPRMRRDIRRLEREDAEE